MLIKLLHANTVTGHPGWVLYDAVGWVGPCGPMNFRVIHQIGGILKYL